MKDYERLRKALDNLVCGIITHCGRDFDWAEVLGEAEIVLADTPKTSEIESLVEWLDGQAKKRLSNPSRSERETIEGETYARIVVQIAEFGYGGQDGQ